MEHLHWSDSLHEKDSQTVTWHEHEHDHPWHETRTSRDVGTLRHVKINWCIKAFSTIWTVLHSHVLTGHFCHHTFSKWHFCLYVCCLCVAWVAWIAYGCNHTVAPRHSNKQHDVDSSERAPDELTTLRDETKSCLTSSGGSLPAIARWLLSTSFCSENNNNAQTSSW